MRHLLFELLEGQRIAFRAIWVNKLRSTLTTLGVIIGIVSVTAMATVVSGIERGFEEDMQELGTDVLYVERWPWVGGPGFKWWEYINRPPISEDIAATLMERSRYVEAATPVVQTARPIWFGDRQLSGASIIGTSAQYPNVFSVDLAEGYFFSELDDRSARDVVVIGAFIADQLFTVEDPIGKEIRVGGRPFRVIAVQARKGQSADSPGGDDFQIKIPFNSFKAHFGTRYRDVSIRAKVGDAALVPAARDEITGILRVARRLDAKDVDNFEINEQASLREQLAPIKAAIYGIGIFLTALSLLVGGIGVMNIMFVSVKERTREIGIRKAVGAQKRTILLQFLIEAVTVSMIGGVIGVLLAIPVTLLVRLALPAVLSVGTVMLAFGICLAVGTVFGLAPAWTAANAEPIDALRYE